MLGTSVEEICRKMGISGCALRELYQSARLLTPEAWPLITDPLWVMAAAGFVRDVGRRRIEIQVPDVRRPGSGRKRCVQFVQNVRYR